MKKSLKYGIATAIAISAAVGYAIYDLNCSRLVELAYAPPPPKDTLYENYEDAIDLGYIEDIIQNI